jgi:hypothetical protein
VPVVAADGIAPMDVEGDNASVVIAGVRVKKERGRSAASYMNQQTQASQLLKARTQVQAAQLVRDFHPEQAHLPVPDATRVEQEEAAFAAAAAYSGVPKPLPHQNMYETSVYLSMFGRARVGRSETQLKMDRDRFLSQSSFEQDDEDIMRLLAHRHRAWGRFGTVPANPLRSVRTGVMHYVKQEQHGAVQQAITEFMTPRLDVPPKNFQAYIDVWYNLPTEMIAGIPILAEAAQRKIEAQGAAGTFIEYPRILFHNPADSNSVWYHPWINDVPFWNGFTRKQLERVVKLMKFKRAAAGFVPFRPLKGEAQDAEDGEEEEVEEVQELQEQHQENAAAAAAAAGRVRAANKKRKARDAANDNHATHDDNEVRESRAY